jgi:large subunit ribosomal protein L11
VKDAKSVCGQNAGCRNFVAVRGIITPACFLFLLWYNEATMAKQLTATVRFHAKGGQATAAPPVGTALGKYGLNLGQFVQQFNERTKGDLGMRIPVVVKVYTDRTFELEAKTPHSVDLLKQAAGIVSGSGNVPKVKVGQVTAKQLDDIAAKKMKDINARTVEAARNILAGTARSMGLDVVK